MCDCKVCDYNKKYLDAVKNNNQEFLIEHLGIYLNTCADEEWWRFKLDQSRKKETILDVEHEIDCL